MYSLFLSKAHEVGPLVHCCRPIGFFNTVYKMGAFVQCSVRDTAVEYEIHSV